MEGGREEEGEGQWSGGGTIMQVLPAENYQLKTGGNNAKRKGRRKRKVEGGDWGKGLGGRAEEENKATERRDASVRATCK